MLTVRQLWVATARRLGSDTEARWIVQESTGLDGVEWVLDLDALVTERVVTRTDAMVQRRLAGEPLQYVLGSWAFRTLDLMVDQRVLIPRPETEEVVEVALALAGAMSPPLLTVDLGTGSGAIALSLAAELPRRWAVEVWAVDSSVDALHVARANLAGIPGWAGTRVRMAAGTWFDALPASQRGRVDLLVSNPPYIAACEQLPAEVVEWEPRAALISGPTGLEAIEVLLAQAPTWLSPQGAMVIEIGAGQAASVLDVAARSGYRNAEIRPDLAGRDRALVVTL